MPTTRAAIYLRISLDHTGDELAIKRQREDCLKIVESRGWELAGEYVDNSISASDERRKRPGYDALCRDYEAGQFGAIVCWDLDRLTRQPRQLEDWIDRSQKRGLRVVTVNGEANLDTDDGRLVTRIKMATAKGEVERKSARQIRAHKQRADMGRPAKGVRLTGYEFDGTVIPEEAEIVRRIFDQFTAGGTLFGIAKGLNEDGVPTRRGGVWSRSSVSSILRNARYAGRSVYKGEDVGEAQWDAIVPIAQFEAAAAKLADPRRKTSGESRARKHLGSGLYYCTCGLRVKSATASGYQRYVCRSACHYRAGAVIDEYVLAIVRGRLAQPDLAELLARPEDESALAALAAERQTLQDRLARFEADYDEGLIDGRRLRAATEKVEARMAEIRTAEAKLVATHGTDSILAAPDPVAAFDAADVAIKQRVVDALLTVTLKPGVHGSRTFRPESVEVRWRGAQPAIAG